MAPDLPGFYFDRAKGKYFKVVPNHHATATTSYSKAAVAAKELRDKNVCFDTPGGAAFPPMPSLYGPATFPACPIDLVHIVWTSRIDVSVPWFFLAVRAPVVLHARDLH
ncbi:MAG: hypothetical protein LQ346_007519 [Caloplaca aetnensis]|nr:MAG: hypothetical protein LQ346_007519 [Caloplaca aetnensis]